MGRAKARPDELDHRTPREGARVVLYWIPLGAGGSAVVRFSGRIYESVCALVQRRRPLDLYHTALEVQLDGARHVIENAWPSPDTDMVARGVVVEGPVWSSRLSRLRVFRYEVRCWEDGIIPDAGAAVAVHTLTRDPEAAQRLLDLAGSVPDMTWGRNVRGVGEMWNSNSVISYLLTISSLRAEALLPPAGGRAPGWKTGFTLASSRLRAASSRDIPNAGLSPLIPDQGPWPLPPAKIGGAIVKRLPRRKAL